MTPDHRLLSSYDPPRVRHFVRMAFFGQALALGAMAAVMGLRSPGAAVAAAVLVALAAAAAACGWATRMMVAVVPVGAGTLRDLIAAVDRAAMQTGAVRRVETVEAWYSGEDRLKVEVALDFKDGVAAQHVAPVLARLAEAVAIACPDVASVVLAPTPSRATDPHRFSAQV